MRATLAFNGLNKDAYYEIINDETMKITSISAIYEITYTGSHLLLSGERK